MNFFASFFFILLYLLMADYLRQHLMAARQNENLRAYSLHNKRAEKSPKKGPENRKSQFYQRYFGAVVEQLSSLISRRNTSRKLCDKRIYNA